MTPMIPPSAAPAAPVVDGLTNRLVPFAVGAFFPPPSLPGPSSITQPLVSQVAVPQPIGSAAQWKNRDQNPKDHRPGLGD